MPAPEARQAIDEIKKRYPIQEVAARYTDLRKSGDNLLGRCPFHDDHNPSFVVHLATATWRCYAGCDVGGDVIDLVGYARHLTAWNSHDAEMFKETISTLTGGSLPPLRKPIPKDWNEPATGPRPSTSGTGRPIELELVTQLLLDITARIYHMTLLTMRRDNGSPYAYLRRRGFDDVTIRRAGLGYASGKQLALALAACGLSRQAAADINLLDPDRNWREFMTGRIVFVDRDRIGCVLHMVGRRFAPGMSELAPKYLSLKEIAKPLHGYAQLKRKRSDKPVIVVESPPDALTARQWGFDAVASIGTGMKAAHAILLARLPRPKIYVPHNDEAGLQAAKRWREKVGEGQIVTLPDSVKDLNELAVLPQGGKLFTDLIQAAG